MTNCSLWQLPYVIKIYSKSHFIAIQWFDTNVLIFNFDRYINRLCKFLAFHVPETGTLALIEDLLIPKY